jgi:hypothetical protein
MTDLEKDLLATFLSLTVPLGVFVAVQVFFKLNQMDCELHILTDGGREIRLDKFAIRCGIHVAFTKWYLNSKARQLNRLREVDDLGDVVYLFGEASGNFYKNTY